MTAVNDDCRFALSEGLVYREEGDGGFLFDPKTGDLKYLNRSARETYLLIDGHRTVREIVESIAGRYPEIEGRTIHQDVTAFLEELAKARFIAG